MSNLSDVHKLTKQDQRGDFTSGAAELDDWLRQYAMQNQKANNAVTYVCTLDGRVVGYYALCSAGVSRGRVPEDFGRNRPADIPCILLARLAVDQRAQGRGVGRSLLNDVIVRSCQAADAIGAACLLIHCRDEDAKAFYLNYANFLQSPVEDLHLVLPIKEARKLLA